MKAVDMELANAAKESSEYLRHTSSMEIFIWSVNSHVLFSSRKKHDLLYERQQL